jgi:hypothetical protein
MEAIVIIFIIILILGAIAGGDSFGSVITNGCGALVGLIVVVAIGATIWWNVDQRKVDLSNNYKLFVYNDTYDKVRYKVLTGSMSKNGKIDSENDGNFEGELNSQDSVVFVKTIEKNKEQNVFMEVKRIDANRNDYAYRYSPEAPLKLDGDTEIHIGYDGISFKSRD